MNGVLGYEWTIFHRKDVAIVDADIFVKWAKLFTDEIRNRININHKVVLLYDAHRSHMTGSVLRIFHKSNIVVVSLPAHFSNKLQPLDVSVFNA